METKHERKATTTDRAGYAGYDKHGDSPRRADALDKALAEDKKKPTNDSLSTFSQSVVDLSKQTPTPMGPKKRDRAADRVRRAERVQAALAGTPSTPVTSRGKGEHSGGSVDYYKLTIEHPTHAKRPYTVECNDIIEALGMDFAEGNVFKALWRTAAARRGKLKRNHNAKYDAEKIVFFGQRLLVRAKRNLGE